MVGMTSDVLNNTSLSFLQGTVTEVSYFGFIIIPDLMRGCSLKVLLFYICLPHIGNYDPLVL
jgi:hypothetical protein